MTKSLKDKTISGLVWSFFDSFSSQIITFVVGIILARLLQPEEFGLIGMITIFIAISASFISSGFSQALIRKKDCSEEDYSTVFLFNIISGLFFFSILFFTAPIISRFFLEPQLLKLVRVLALILIIDGFTIIQRTILTKRIDFKLQTKISVIAALLSGLVSITMAFNGFGVWSLVAKTLIQRGVNSMLLWVWNRWRPILVFSWDSFRELFTFGFRLLLSGLIDTIYRNVYFLIIGKFFSAQELGYYVRADRFSALPSENINTIITKVSYPVLSSIKENSDQLKAGYKRLITSTMLISFVLMLGMAAVAEPMIITLIGEKWRSSIIYLQMLCFIGMLYPLHALNLNMLLVLGRSDLGLKLEIIKKILAVPVVIIGVFLGIKAMIIGMIINSFIAYIINSYWSGSLIGYSMKEQVNDILPSFAIASISMGFVFVTGSILGTAPLITLLVQIILGALIIYFACEKLKLKEYLYIKDILISKLKSFWA